MSIMGLSVCGAASRRPSPVLVPSHLVLHLPLAPPHLLKHHGQRPREQSPVLVPRRPARDGKGLAGARLPSNS